jgi:hypothetical protein
LFLSCNGDFDELFMDSLGSIILTDEKEWRRKNYTNQCWLITSVKLFICTFSLLKTKYRITFLPEVVTL